MQLARDRYTVMQISNVHLSGSIAFLQGSHVRGLIVSRPLQRRTVAPSQGVWLKNAPVNIAQAMQMRRAALLGFNYAVDLAIAPTCLDRPQSRADVS